MSIELYHANGIAKNVQNKTPEEKKKEREEQEKMQEEMLQPEEERGNKKAVTPSC